MKKKLIVSIFAFFISLVTFAQGGTQSILFTAKANAVNGVDVYAKNITGSTVSGILGASNLSLCLLLPSSLSPQPTVTISSPIAGQTFATLLHNTGTAFSTAYDIYTFNGLGSTASIDFPSNTEVLIATYTLTGPTAITGAALGMLSAAGPSGFDQCYIAPGGTDATNYSAPFYGLTALDPNIHNCNGDNDLTTNCTSIFTVSPIIVPVKFVGFSATKNADNALLNWDVANETGNTDHYELERSTDGTSSTFSTIADIAVKGGATTNSYNYTDANISAVTSTGTIYYRIKQVDKDGQVTYTKIETVKLSALSINAYPNPVKDVVSISMFLIRGSKLSLSLTDAAGKQLRSIQTTGIKGNNINKMNLQGLASGSYLLKVTTGIETATLSIFKR